MKPDRRRRKPHRVEPAFARHIGVLPNAILINVWEQIGR